MFNEIDDQNPAQVAMATVVTESLDSTSAATNQCRLTPARAASLTASGATSLGEQNAYLSGSAISDPVFRMVKMVLFRANYAWSRR